MKNSLLLISFCFILSPGLTQIRSRNIENIRLDYKNGRVLVHYDLNLKTNSKDCSIDIFFVDDQYNCIKPFAIKGDVGAGMTAGINKTISWDYNESSSILRKGMRPVLIQNQNEYFALHGFGSQSAFYSILLPGLGDHKVADPSEMIFKPYFRTISSLAFIGGGFLALNNRVKTDAYRVYESGFDRHPDFFPSNVKYWLFPFDSEILIGVGASIWIADILWVYSHGRINDRMTKSLKESNISLRLSPQSIGASMNF
jgi:hypothetical protein